MKSLDPLRLSILPSLILAVLLAVPRPLVAAILPVTNLGDSGMTGQLRTLITLAAPGDTIVIPPGTITLAGPAGEDLNGGGDLDISKNLTIQGAGPGATIIDGGGIDRVFDINPSGQGGIEVTISGVTIRNGKPGAIAGGILNRGTLTLTKSTVTSNTGLNFGGGGVYNLGTMTLTDTTVTGNTTLGSNLSGGGGGILNEGTMTLTGTTVSGNTTIGRGGGIYNLDQTTTLVNSTINGNTALNGGGIFNRFGTVQLTNSTNTGNTATDNGGGIWNFGGTLTLANTIVSANTAATPSGDCAGVIASLGHNLASDASCALGGTGDLNNTAPLLGPLQSNGGPTQTHALLPGSPAIDAGDNKDCPDTDQRGFPRPRDGNGNFIETCDIGAYEAPPPPVAVTNFGDTGAPGQLRTLINTAADGDTVVIPAGTITLTEPGGGSLDITRNLMLQGAGPTLTSIDSTGGGAVLKVTGGSVVISGVTIGRGSAGAVASSGTGPHTRDASAAAGGCAPSATPRSGSGIAFNSLAPQFLMDSCVIGNSNTSLIEGGGGITIATGAGPVTLIGVTLSGNSAATLGGGIFNGGASLTLINDTVSGNTAGFNGGGIANSTAGSVVLNNVTLSSNSANTSGGGGGLFNGGGSVQLKNTIVANSPAGGNCSGPIFSLGHNLDSGATCGFNQPGDLSNAAPLLGPLQSNGGPTQSHALLSGSPAIDAGNPAGCTDNLGVLLTTDQRGFGRPQGTACDIGAYEAFVFDPAPATAFVTRLYEEVLGRAPDPVGLQGHLASIVQFGSVVTTVLAFFHSPEFLFRSTTNEQFLTILYGTFLNRAPDPGGFTIFLGDLSGGCRTRDDLLGIFIRSQEFQALASFLPPLDPVTAFVTNLYILTLGRGPDQAGLQGFVAQLQQTRQVLPVVQGFLGSSEFLGRNTTNTEYVTVLFGVFLDRVPDCKGLAFFVGRLDLGTAIRVDIAKEFADSPEFQAIQRRLFP